MLADPAVAPLLRQARTGLIITALITLSAGVASIAAAIQRAEATTRILTGAAAPLTPLIGAGLTLLLRAGLLWLRDLSAHRTGHRVVDRLRLELLEHIVALGPGASLAGRWRAFPPSQRSALWSDAKTLWPPMRTGCTRQPHAL